MKNSTNRQFCIADASASPVGNGHLGGVVAPQTWAADSECFRATQSRTAENPEEVKPLGIGKEAVITKVMLRDTVNREFNV